MKLNDKNDGDYLKLSGYDSNAGSCTTDNYPVTSWAENVDNKTLIVTVNIGLPYALQCVYLDKDKLYWDAAGDGSQRVVFKRK